MQCMLAVSLAELIGNMHMLYDREHGISTECNTLHTCIDITGIAWTWHVYQSIYISVPFFLPAQFVHKALELTSSKFLCMCIHSSFHVGFCSGTFSFAVWQTRHG